MNKIEYDYYCPVCGCELDFLPWKGDNPSDEICPCCYIQFGYEDLTAPDEKEKRIAVYNEYRDYWIKNGMIWNSTGQECPSNWDPKKQLQNIGVFIK